MAYGTRKESLITPVLNAINLILRIDTHFLKTFSNIILLHISRNLPRYLFPVSLPTKILNMLQTLFHSGYMPESSKFNHYAESIAFRITIW